MRKEQSKRALFSDIIIHLQKSLVNDKDSHVFLKKVLKFR